MDEFINLLVRVLTFLVLATFSWWKIVMDDWILDGKSLGKWE